MKLGLIPIFAEDAGNVCFVDLVIRNGSPRADGRQQRRDEENINQYVFHPGAKVEQDSIDLSGRTKKFADATDASRTGR